MTTERCPRCNGIVRTTIHPMMPPITRKTCEKCGQSWTMQDKQEDIVFNPEGWEDRGRG